MSFSFSQLSLSGVQAAAGISVLKPGRYAVTVKEAEIKQNKNKNGHILVVKLVCDQGVITDNINVQHESQKAQEIGLGQLKALLIAGGHPDPDNPGGVENIKGLKVGIYVAQDGVYEGKEQYKVKGYMPVEEVGTGTSAAATPTAPIGKGGLPF